MGRRRIAREDALRLLYQTEICPSEDLDETLRTYWEERDQEADPEIRDYAEQIVRGVRDNLEEIDAKIQASAHNWRLERLAAVDRNILRVAVFELVHQDDVPPAVIINEAIEVAKRYASDESSQFINGVLDGIHRTLDDAREATLERGGS